MRARSPSRLLAIALSMAVLAVLFAGGIAGSGGLTGGRAAKRGEGAPLLEAPGQPGALLERDREGPCAASLRSIFVAALLPRAVRLLPPRRIADLLSVAVAPPPRFVFAALRAARAPPA